MPVLKDSTRRIVRVALIFSAIGLAGSTVAHGLSFLARYSDPPGWFIPVVLGIFPLGAVGIYVCYWIGLEHGTWGSGEQWAFIDERLPRGFRETRTALFFYALSSFLWLGLTGSLKSGESFPLGMFSAFTATFYAALLTVFTAALTRSPRPPSRAAS